MGIDERDTQTAQQECLLRTWRKRHPYLFRLGLGWAFVWLAQELHRSLNVIFAPWPSMHSPVNHLLNATNTEEADQLTDKWAQGKQKELQYVGISSALITGTIASGFSWNNIGADPWATEVCWLGALVFALTAISLATQQTIGLSRLCMCENGGMKVRSLLGEVDPLSLRNDLEQSPLGRPQGRTGGRMRMKRSQLWMWQTPVMLANFAVLLFIIGLMISIFVRAARSRGDWTTGDNQVAILFGCAAAFAGFNYLFCWICLNKGSLRSENE